MLSVLAALASAKKGDASDVFHLMAKGFRSVMSWRTSLRRHR
jgi:hypothetical protein